MAGKKGDPAITRKWPPIRRDATRRKTSPKSVSGNKMTFNFSGTYRFQNSERSTDFFRIDKHSLVVRKVGTGYEAQAALDLEAEKNYKSAAAVKIVYTIRNKKTGNPIPPIVIKDLWGAILTFSADQTRNNLKSKKVPLTGVNFGQIESASWTMVPYRVKKA